jgi:hypothetical protein
MKKEACDQCGKTGKALYKCWGCDKHLCRSCGEDFPAEGVSLRVCKTCKDNPPKELIKYVEGGDEEPECEGGCRL